MRVSALVVRVDSRVIAASPPRLPVTSRPPVSHLPPTPRSEPPACLQTDLLSVQRETSQTLADMRWGCRDTQIGAGEGERG